MGGCQGSNVHRPSWFAGCPTRPPVREQQQPGECPHVRASLHSRRVPQHRAGVFGPRSHDRETARVCFLATSLRDWGHFRHVFTDIDGVREGAKKFT